MRGHRYGRTIAIPLSARSPNISGAVATSPSNTEYPIEAIHQLATGAPTGSPAALSPGRFVISMRPDLYVPRTESRSLMPVDTITRVIGASLEWRRRLPPAKIGMTTHCCGGPRSTERAEAASGGQIRPRSLISWSGSVPAMVRSKPGNLSHRSPGWRWQPLPKAPG